MPTRPSRPARPLRAALLAALLLPLALAARPAAAEVRVAVLKFGTVNWELDVIAEHGLDRKHGIELEVIHLTNKDATAVALLSDAADVIVTDWIWVSRQRAAGDDFALVPYSNAAGSVMAHPDSGIRSFADLFEGRRRLGVAGSSVDKSWLLVRAYGLETVGEDLADAARVSFAAPPLLNQMLLTGELDAVITFWNFTARLRAAGMREVLPVPEVLPRLGVAGKLPLIGYVFRESWARENPGDLAGFLAASREARGILAASDAEWERIRPLTGARDDDAILAALRDAFRAGIPDPDTDATVPVAAAFSVLARIGGRALVGRGGELAGGTLWPPAR